MNDIFLVEGKVVAITGAGGVLCSTIARHLASAGARVAVLDINIEAAAAVADDIKAGGGEGLAVECNVLDKESLAKAKDMVVGAFGKIDVLINGAGGNKKDATCVPPRTFFELPIEAFRGVFELNCIGTVLPSMVFGEYMADRGEGIIINVASMSGIRPLTNVGGYSAAKAGVANFTQWLSTYMAQRHSTNIRVNAIAPGFFLTEQNRFLLTDEKSGDLTARGRTIIDHTPAGRFGEAEDLVGAVRWLISDASKFVTGAVIPIDGGFSAFSGV